MGERFPLKIVFLLILFLGVLSCTRPKDSDAFTFHMFVEPHSLDTARLTYNSGSYLFHNVYRSLFSYSKKGKLQPEGAKQCTWRSSTHLRCFLEESARFSNGTRVEAKHYIKSFHHLFQSQSQAVQHLMHLKNAKSILQNQKPISELGVQAITSHILDFYLEEPFKDFIFNLAATPLTPLFSTNFPDKANVENLVHFGPYHIRRWKSQRYIYLKSNPFYRAHQQRHSRVKILFVEDDSTSLNLFQSGRLNFLRRLVTQNIDLYRDKKQFMETPLARMDYIGFHPELQKNLDFKKALAFSLNYKELQRIYRAKSPGPGCIGLPFSYTEQPALCHSFDVKKARKHWNNLDKSLRDRTFRLGFSKVGGEDIKRGMTWLQSEWKQHLGMKIELQAIEKGSLVATLLQEPPDLFRKGMPLEHPTCLSVLQFFHKDHPRNFTKYDSSFFQLQLSQLRKKGQDPRICYRALSRMMQKDFGLIPLGSIYYAMMNDLKFQGFSINEMNQLDLSQLQRKPWLPTGKKN